MGLEATFLKVSQLSKDIKLADGAKFANIKSKDLVNKGKKSKQRVLSLKASSGCSSRR